MIETLAIATACTVAGFITGAVTAYLAMRDKNK